MGHRKFQEVWRLAEAYWSALRFDLLGRVDLPRDPLNVTDWELVALCIEQLQRDPSSALFRAMVDSILSEMPDDPDAAAEEPSEADDVNALFAARMGPLYGLLRLVERNQRLQMYQQGHGDDEPLPELLPMPGDVLTRLRERRMNSMDSDIAGAYFALLQPPTETG